MKKYRVLVKGQNLFIVSDGEVKCFGFYTPRFVEAMDEGGAELRAINSIRQNGQLRECVMNNQSDQPILVAEEIDELISFEGVEDLSPGLVFYEDRRVTH